MTIKDTETEHLDRESKLRTSLTQFYAALFIASPIVLEICQDYVNQHIPEIANNFIFQNVGNSLEGWFPAVMAYVTVQMVFPDKDTPETLQQK